MDQNLYYDILPGDIMSDSQMSLWGSMPQVFKPPVPPSICTTQQSQQQRHSNCSTPTTPPYSQSLALENQMVGPNLLIGGNTRQHHAAPATTISVPLNASSDIRNSSAGKRSRKNNYVDPCAIAPLKKRRIQVNLLSPDDRDKVLHKREKNKVAAEKCRIKRREQVQQTRGEYEDYLEANEKAEAEIRLLKEELQMLEDSLRGHKCVQVHV